MSGHISLHQPPDAKLMADKASSAVVQAFKDRGGVINLLPSGDWPKPKNPATTEETAQK